MEWLDAWKFRAKRNHWLKRRVYAYTLYFGGDSYDKSDVTFRCDGQHSAYALDGNTEASQFMDKYGFNGAYRAYFKLKGYYPIFKKRIV